MAEMPDSYAPPAPLISSVDFGYWEVDGLAPTRVLLRIGGGSSTKHANSTCGGSGAKGGFI